MTVRLTATRGGAGLVHEFGEWDDRRTAVKVARAISQADATRTYHFTTVDPTERLGHNDTLTVSRAVQLKPPLYDPDLEITLSDGRTVWLGDVDAKLRAALDAPAPAPQVQRTRYTLATCAGCRRKIRLEGRAWMAVNGPAGCSTYADGIHVPFDSSIEEMPTV